MQISHLSLTNFRNFARLELDLPPGPTLLHGDNAQGKTNLLEAIFYLATTRSPQADSDQQLLNWDALIPGEPIVAGRLVAQLQTSEGQRLIELRLIREQRGSQTSFRREALVNRRKVRLMDLLGNLRVVLFIPEDVQLVTGAPSRRRRYLDITLCQSDRDYCRALSTFNKVLEQRNALLRAIAEGNGSRDLLSVYDEKLAMTGAVIFLKRAAFVSTLGQVAQQIHFEQLTDRKENLWLDYLPRFNVNGPGNDISKDVKQAIEAARWLDEQEAGAVEQRYLQLLHQARDVEIAAGVTRIGPHRDDWQFLVGGRELSVYGSRGQQRGAILALKLAEIAWMEQQTGEQPILLLDEVLAELDEQRRALLLETVEASTQSVLTATDPSMFTGSFLKRSTIMSVYAGRIAAD